MARPLPPSFPLLRTGWRAPLRHVLVWGALFVLFLPFFTNNHVQHVWAYDTITMGAAVVYYYLNAYGLVPQLFERGHYVGFFAALLGLGLAIAAGRLALEYWLYADDILHAFPSRERYRVYALTNMGVVAVVSSYNQILTNRRRAEQQGREIIQRQQESQLLYLRAQINPHFLFNTLNNIYALSLAQAPETPEMVLRLAGLLRYAIYSTSRQRVSVDEEVAQVHELLALYRMRCAGPVDLHLDVAPAARAARLEPMLLIPLVENCLKHGDVEYNPTGYVHIALRVVNGYLEVTTRNTTDATSLQPAAPAGSAEGVATHGVGLTNIRRRLQLTYPDGAATLLTSRTANIFKAVLRLPMFPR